MNIDKWKKKPTKKELYDLIDYYNKEIERLNNIIKQQDTRNSRQRIANRKLQEELQIEKATNKELLSTGADLESKLYEEQDKNKRLNNIINELEKHLIEEIENYEKQIKFYKKNKDLRSGILDLVGEYEGEKVCFEDMLGRLQDLKGSDKE